MSFTSVVCSVCGKEFQKNDKFAGMRAALSTQQGDICYDCALDRLTSGRAPEEGDFNSARIISGEMSDNDARQLQSDLESIDHAAEEAHWRRMVEDYDDEGRWDYLEGWDEDE